MRDLIWGESVKVLLDPLSHGSNMLSCLATYEVVRVDNFHVSDEQDEEIPVEIAIVKITGAHTVKWGEPENEAPDDGTWDPEKMVGQLETWVSVNGKSWFHTAWPVEVDFYETAN